MRFRTLLVCLLLLTVSTAPAFIQTARAPTGGKYFDHIVIIAMENRNYGEVSEAQLRLS